MRVRILSATTNMLKLIWCAARTCYSPHTPSELWDQDSSPGDADMLRLARHVLSAGHLSVAEHCSVTYAVEGVSRVLLAQYSRHRIGVSLSVQSQRHVRALSTGDDESMVDSVIPPSLSAKPGALDEYNKFLRDSRRTYDNLVSLGVPKEDARFVLPGGSRTNFVTTLNVRSLMDVYRKRVLTPGAQWEIRQLLITMADLLVEREGWLREFLPLPSKRQ